MNIAFKGVIWSAIERYATQGMSFVLTIILAKLIAPSDFGQIAMLAVFITIAQSFIDSGFSQALIQKKNPTRVDYSTVFYFNLGVSSATYIILYLCSPLISDFYNMPSLTPVCRVLGLDIIFNAFAIVQRTRLTVEMDFKKMSLISIVATLVSGIIGIILAIQGYGIWALLVQRLSNTIIQVLLLWFVTAWRPLLEFSKDSFRQLFSFGYKILIGGMITNVYNNIYPLVIGRFYNSSEVAFFTWSNSVASFPSGNISGIISKVAFPILSRKQDDRENLNRTTLSIIRLITIFTFPIMLLVSLFSSKIVEVLLTPAWAPAVPMLCILSISSMLLPIMQQNWLYINAQGRSDITLKAEVIKKVIAVLILCCTVPLGLVAICIGTLVYSIADMLIIIYYAGKVGGLTFRVQIKNLSTISIGAAGAYFAALALRFVFDDSLLMCISEFLVFSAIYYLFIRKFNSKDILIFKHMISK